MSALAVIRAECYRYSRSVGVRWLVVLPALIAVLRMVGALVFERASGVDPSRSVDDAVETTGFALLADGLRTGGAVVTFVALVLGAMGLVRDRENGMLATGIIARGRVSLVVGRALALALVVLLAWGGVVATASGVASFTRGLVGLEIEGVEVVAAAELWDDVIAAILTSLPPLIAAAWFALAVSAFADGSGFAMAGSLVPFVSFDVLKSALPDAAPYVFSTYAPLLADGSTVARLTGLARGFANVDWAEHELLLSACVPAASGVVLILVAIAVTMRRPA
jgi:hypothetical protein